MLSGFPQHPLWFEGRGQKGTAPWSHSVIQEFPHHLLEQESKNQDSWTDFVPKPVFCIACGQSGAFAFLKGYIYKKQEQDEQRIDYSAFSGKKKNCQPQLQSLVSLDKILCIQSADEGNEGQWKTVRVLVARPGNDKCYFHSHTNGHNYLMGPTSNAKHNYKYSLAYAQLKREQKLKYQRCIIDMGRVF